MKTRTWVCVAALSAALASAAGCSFVLVQGPPAGHEKLAAVSCTRSNAVPILDAALAAVGLYTGGMLLNAGERSGGWLVGASVIGGGMLAEGVLFGASSIVGFTRTSHCRAAQRRAAEGPR